MMMTDREKLFELLRDGKKRVWGWFPNNVTMMQIADYLLANGVAIVKHAHWIINGDWAECSNCHEDEKIAVLVHKDYCPACGAIMDEESVVIHP